MFKHFKPDHTTHSSPSPPQKKIKQSAMFSTSSVLKWRSYLSVKTRGFFSQCIPRCFAQNVLFFASIASVEVIFNIYYQQKVFFSHPWCPPYVWRIFPELAKAYCWNFHSGEIAERSTGIKARIKINVCYKKKKIGKPF